MLTPNRFYRISGIDEFIKHNKLTQIKTVGQIIMSKSDYEKMGEIFINNPMTILRVKSRSYFYFYYILGAALPTYDESVPAGEVWFVWK